MGLERTLAGLSNPCYNREGEAQRCVPDFVNAAFNRRVEATNTCGESRPLTYCQQTGHQGINKASAQPKTLLPPR